MSKRALRIVTAAVEAGAGVALLVAPSWAAELLVGEGLSSPSSLVVARIAAAALMSIAVACGLERNGARSGLVAGLLLYNIAVPLVLLEARFDLQLDGILLWPAIVLHAGLAVWCFVERAS